MVVVGVVSLGKNWRYSGNYSTPKLLDGWATLARWQAIDIQYNQCLGARRAPLFLSP